MRKAEEQRIAREEEKRRIFLEEERRKQAAKQKLLELEEKIARRKADAAKGGNDSLDVVDEKISGIVKENDTSRGIDVGEWDDSEKVAEGIKPLGSSDSSSLNKPLDTGSRPSFSKDVSSTFVDRGKLNSWRRDAYENERNSVFYQHDQDNGQNSPHRDSPIGGKPFMRKEYYGGGGFMTSRTSHKGGTSEAHSDEFANLKGWNQTGDGNHLSRNMEVDSDFHDNFVEKFGDSWTHGRSRGNSLSPYPDRPYPNSESDGPYSFGRSRYSVRQPRVLPPPSLSSSHKTYRNVNGSPGPSAFLENEIRYDHAARRESIMPTGYDSSYQGNSGQLEEVGPLLDNNENDDHRVVDRNTIQRCDSQSSLSVSSPPSSPTHLSHDDLDESGVSPVILASGEGKNGPLSSQQNESIVMPARAGNGNVVNSPSAISVGDDEEWTTENNEQFQEQEEYDEDEDYREEDEVHDVDDNVQVSQELEDMNLEEKGLPQMMDNLVLGFDEGVQVGMPNEEFERTSKNADSSFMAHQVSGGAIEEHVSFGNSCGDGKALQSVNSSQENLNASSSVFQELEKPTQDLVIQPNNVHTPGASESSDNAKPSNGEMSAHHNVPTSVIMGPYLSSDKTDLSNVAAAPSQVELPVKLQFGLFSGPSLIPSPVPAIQIGSIQMPLHLHPPVGAPHSHMHSSQSPLFQFGQLRYTSPISQGMMSMGPQPLSFIQPNIPSGFSFNNNPGGPMALQTGPDMIDGFIRSEVGPHSVDNQPGHTRDLNLSQGSLPSDDAENVAGIKEGQFGAPHDGSTKNSTGFQVDKLGQQSLAVKRSNNSSNARESEAQSHGSNLSTSKEMHFEKSKEQFPASGGRGRRYAFTVKSPSSKLPGPTPRVSRRDTNGFLRKNRRNIQRTEFRIRDSAEKRLSPGLVSSDQFGSDKSNINGRGTSIPARAVPKKVWSNKVGKQAVASATENSQDVDSLGRVDKVDGKEATKIQTTSYSGQSNLKRNLCSVEDVDAPLQSGIIRVFEQPGIEAPSDEDDFIEVRSKRQMLNDRREQREKEIKAKSRVSKVKKV